MKILLLGCGRARDRKIFFKTGAVDFSDDDLTTIDIDPSCEPTIRMDLRGLSGGEALPAEDGAFDEIHAYDVLEHIGTLGDWQGYFTEFSEYHRVLKHGGRFFILVPVGAEALADMGHTRLFHQNHFAFLSQAFYTREQEAKTAVTDYRWWWKKDFEIDYMEVREGHHIAVILRKA